MKRILYIIILIAIGSNVIAQERQLLSYFTKIKEDSIIDTGDDILMRIGNLCDKYIPDSITLKYFFNNDTANMYYEKEDYSPDFDKWNTKIIKKNVCPLFYKKNREYYLLCYKIISIIYLSIYDAKRDTIISTYIVSDYTDEYGNQVTHSIIFPNNYIATVEIIPIALNNSKVIYKLVKIEGQNFNIIKKVEIKKEETEQVVYKKVYERLGITEKGELIK